MKTTTTGLIALSALAAWAVCILLIVDPVPPKSPTYMLHGNIMLNVHTGETWKLQQDGAWWLVRRHDSPLAFDALDDLADAAPGEYRTKAAE